MSGFLSSVETMEKIVRLHNSTSLPRGQIRFCYQNLSQFFIVSEEFKEANDGFPVVLGAGSTNFANLQRERHRAIIGSSNGFRTTVWSWKSTPDFLGLRRT